jgi:hypothetical protein
MATYLQDTDLLSRIEGGDLIALDAKYHLACLTLLRNRHRSLLRQREMLARALYQADREGGGGQWKHAYLQVEVTNVVQHALPQLLPLIYEKLLQLL